jgi:hypothetical protein
VKYRYVDVHLERYIPILFFISLVKINKVRVVQNPELYWLGPGIEV